MLFLGFISGKRIRLPGKFVQNQTNPGSLTSTQPFDNNTLRYHALKANYRNGKFSKASDSMTQAQLRKNWSLFAEVLMAEAGKARVHHRAISLSRFICFLCNGSLPGNSVSDCVHVHSDISWFRRIRECDVEKVSLGQDISEKPRIRFGIEDPSISFLQNDWLRLFCLPCTEG